MLNRLMFNNSRYFKYFSTARPKRIENLINEWTTKLRQSNADEDANFTLKCIAAHVSKQKFSLIHDIHSVELTDDQVENFERLCECRLARMPLQYIIGEWDFLDLTLKMQPTVFIPRPETESFVKLVLKHINREEPLKFLEIGCGTGAISLAMLRALPNARAIAFDRSRVACELSKENAKLLNLHDRISVHHHRVQVDEMLPATLSGESFDLIVSNPPYVKSADLPSLAPEITLYENLNALDGGPDGLNVARVLCKLAAQHLVKNGKLWMELDSNHPPAVKVIVDSKHAGTLQYLNSFKDLYGKERFVEIARI